jgi:hypothetical protein
MAKMDLELGAVLGREVELRTYEDLSSYSGMMSGHRRVCSMPLDDEVRVRHLVEAASKAVSYASGRSRADLDDDELLRLALTKLVEIVGEAAKYISDDLRKSRPEVP